MNVSHVITTKGRANFLRTALDHAENIRTPGSEIIVVDGAESDEVKLVVEQAGNVDVFISKKDDSNCTGHNRGIEVATCPVIHPMTDDDWYHQPALSIAAQSLVDNNLGILFCGGTKVLVNPNSVWGHSADKCMPLGTNYGHAVQDVFDWGASGVGFLFTRDVWAKVGGFDPAYAAADIEMMLKCIDQGLEARFLRVNMYTHPIYPHSFLVSRRPDITREIDELAAKYGCQRREVEMQWQIPPVWDGEFA